MSKRIEKLINENRGRWVYYGDFKKRVEEVALEAIRRVFGGIGSDHNWWSGLEWPDLRVKIKGKFDERIAEIVTSRENALSPEQLMCGAREKWTGKTCGEDCVDWSPVPGTGETIGVCISPDHIRRGMVFGCDSEACQWIREETVARRIYSCARKEEPEDVGEGRNGDSESSSQDS